MKIRLPRTSEDFPGPPRTLRNPIAVHGFEEAFFQSMESAWRHLEEPPALFLGLLRTS